MELKILESVSETVFPNQSPTEDDVKPTEREEVVQTDVTG